MSVYRGSVLSSFLLFLLQTPATRPSLSVLRSYERHLNALSEQKVPHMRIKRYKCVEEYVDDITEENSISSQPLFDGHIESAPRTFSRVPFDHPPQISSPSTSSALPPLYIPEFEKRVMPDSNSQSSAFPSDGTPTITFLHRDDAKNQLRKLTRKDIDTVERKAESEEETLEDARTWHIPTVAVFRPTDSPLLKQAFEPMLKYSGNHSDAKRVWAYSEWKTQVPPATIKGESRKQQGF